MAYVTRQQMATIAAGLGHADLTVEQTPTGRSWYATCSCGYRSTNKMNSAQATSSAVHHLELVMREYAASGSPQIRAAEPQPESA